MSRAGARGGNRIHPSEDADEKPFNIDYRIIFLCFVRFPTVIPGLEKAIWRMREKEITESRLRRKTPAASEAPPEPWVEERIRYKSWRTYYESLCRQAGSFQSLALKASAH